MKNRWITLMLTARYWAHWRKCLGTINYKMLKMLWEPGFLYIVCSEVVRAWASFTCFTFSSIGQELVGCLLGVGVVVLGLVLLVCFVLSVTDLSFWSSCLTMTTLAQLHDCHSCNDERSIVQKKSSSDWVDGYIDWFALVLDSTCVMLGPMELKAGLPSTSVTGLMKTLLSC